MVIVKVGHIVALDDATPWLLVPRFGYIFNYKVDAHQGCLQNRGNPLKQCGVVGVDLVGYVGGSAAHRPVYFGMELHAPAKQKEAVHG